MTFRAIGLFLAAVVVSIGVLPAAAQSAPIEPRTSPTPVVDANGCNPRQPTGRLLAQSVAASGKASAGLRVIDPASGDELGTIDLPAVDAAFPTALPNRALAIAGGALYLIDTAALTATAIPLGEPATGLTPNPIQFRGSAGTRYLLLGSPSFDKAFLIDAEEGDAADLAKLVLPETPDAAVSVPFAAVSPDDEHVLMWDGRHVYVVNTATPEGARQIDTGAFAFAPDFSPDGKDVIYSRSDGPGSGSELVLESIDGTSFEVIATSEHAMVTLWVPGGRTILVDERTEAGAAAGSAYLLDLDTGEETPLLDYTGSLTTVQFNPAGTRALLGAESMSSGSWYLADLTTGAVDELPLLAGSRVLPGLYADSRWALAVPFGDSADLLSRPSYRIVDLETGAVGRLLQQQDGIEYPQQPMVSADGRFSLVTGKSSFEQTVWLLDAVDLRAAELATGRSVSALFSPDGCQVAVTVETSIDGLPSFRTTIDPVADGLAIDAGEGRALAWTAGDAEND